MELNTFFHNNNRKEPGRHHHRSFITSILCRTCAAMSASNAQSITHRIILLGAILTLGQLAEILHKSSRVFLYQQAQCLLYYTNLDPTKIQSGFRIDEALCKAGPIQSRLAAIDGIDSFLAHLPRKSRLAE